MKKILDAENLQSNLLEWKEQLFVYKFALEEINTKLNILNEEYQHIHHHNPIEHMKSRIKSPASIVKKLERKGLEVTIENALEHIQDIAGVRITCSFLSDIYTMFDAISRQDDIEVIRVKDYIRQPKLNGYKSLHLIVKVPVFLSNQVKKVKVEIQIRTIAMDFWASLEHKIYYKFDKEIPQELQLELKQAAEAAHDLDEKMKKIRDEVDLYKNNINEKQV
ncbi:GTP pyrophosphokinase family protein [Niallia endozanthoxylica]|uniref:GTP pyrophosphokinase family protein n=2 Tax=Niallia endozanthoxylica TaxID=2036016 RepID=A0A5J5I6J4_9BACI|nr:GTP pyrophosphokinase family protein [Niallia endozanthoxylica]